MQAVGASTVHIASHPEPHSFAFDHVAPEATTQAEMFALAGKPVVDNCLGGYNGCLLAYGQTGSGKTYTMLGDEDVAEAGDPTNEGRGLIIRVFEQLFAALQQQQDSQETCQTRIRCSFLEIYNETISDLLTGGSNLALREDVRRGTYVEGLSEMEVNNGEFPLFYFCLTRTKHRSTSSLVH